MSASSTAKLSSYRKELDGLRALAVIAVIINHFNKDFLQSGYLGVDIFFVISGYVITSSLARRKTNNFFDFLISFYERRIKRLVPALVFYVVILSLVTCLLNPSPKDSLLTASSSLIGFSNFQLFKTSTDYFAQTTSLNSFTHTWSLGVEEQFYFVYPFIVWFSGFSRNTSKGLNNLFFILLFLTSISFISFIYLYGVNQPAAYFLMPFRFWEISSGCLAYLLIKRNSISYKLAKNIPSILILIPIICILMLPISLATYSITAIVILTILLIYSLESKSYLFYLFQSRILTSIGLISYSLYLWHWGILAISRWTIGIHWWSIPLQTLLILTVSLISYNFIEYPIRNSSFFKSSWQTIALGFSVSIVNAIAFLNIANTINSKLYLPKILGVIEPLPASWGPDLDCHGGEDLAKYSKPFEVCLMHSRKDNNDKRFYLIGDSHAAQFSFMAEKALVNSDYKLAFINTGDRQDFPYSFLSSLNPIISSPTINEILNNVKEGDIVSITFHRGHLNKLVNQHVNPYITQQQKESLFISKQNFSKFISILEGKNVKVLLIRDVPLLKVDNIAISTCRVQQRLLNWNLCDVSKYQDDLTRANQDELFDYLNRIHSNVYSWDPKLHMNNKPGIYSFNSVNGLRIMRDQDHLTKDFSIYLAPKFREFLFNRKLLF